jgi:CTP:molybdopterin cytidylyltransferase MocA
VTVAIAVVVAAGEGRRLGGVAKALLPIGAGGAAGETFLARIAATARAAGVTGAVVVVGAPHGDAVAAAARALGLEVAVNPAPARGMASSVAAGFSAVAAAGAGFADADVALLWPVDHPWVTAPAVARVLAALAAAPGVDAAIPTHGGRGGHPPAIRRALWPALAACAEQPDGARGVLAAARTVRVEVDDPGVVRDVDRLEDR